MNITKKIVYKYFLIKGPSMEKNWVRSGDVYDWPFDFGYYAGAKDIIDEYKVKWYRRLCLNKLKSFTNIF